MFQDVYVFDGSQTFDIQQAHRKLAAGLGFPSFYSHNLDALYDQLTTIGGRVKVIMVVIYPLDFIFNVGDEARRFLSVLKEAAFQNPNFDLRMILNDYELRADD